MILQIVKIDGEVIKLCISGDTILDKASHIFGFAIIIGK